MVYSVHLPLVISQVQIVDKVTVSTMHVARLGVKWSNAKGCGLRAFHTNLIILRLEVEQGFADSN